MVKSACMETKYFQGRYCYLRSSFHVSQFFLSMYCRLRKRYAMYNMLNQVKMDDNAEGRLSFKVNWIILEVHNVNPMEQ